MLLFLREILSGAGVDGSAYRSEPLLRRASACLRQMEAEDLPQARWMLRAQPWRIRRGAQALLIGVTEFFRDPPLFDSLRDELLPALPSDRPLRIWSAGCSDGAELYSMAILLAEAGLLHPDSLLLGTDCRLEAIEAARHGLFSCPSLRRLDPVLKQRYLDPVGSRFRISQSIASLTRWRVSDLLASVEPGPWDVVFCRNLAMYLSEEVSASLWDRLTSVLRPGGFLVTGKAERPRTPGLQPMAFSIYRLESGGIA